jgi:hypothetical protein
MGLRNLVSAMLIAVQLLPGISQAGSTGGAALAAPGFQACAAQPLLAMGTADDSAATLERLQRALAPAVAGLRIDPTEQADELDLDGGADAIVDWVAEQVHFDAYQGLLRGSRGTLISGAGNALDQAVLLAQMLRDAAYDARIARGTLTQADAGRLLATLWNPRERQATAASFDSAAFARASGVPETVLRDFEAKVQAFELTGSDAYREAVAARDLILDRLDRAGVKLGSDVTDALVEQTRDYYWVQYRTRAAGPWLDAHPAFGALPGPQDVTVAETFADTVPEALQHRLRIEFTLERKRGERLETTALMTPWERPVANLLGVRMSVGNAPLGLPAGTTPEQLGEAIRARALFAPTFMGKLAPGAQAFDLFGNVVPPDAAGNVAAGVIQTVTQRGARAAEALGGLGADSDGAAPQFALTAQWIDYILIAPDGSETRHRRFVFDRLTPESRAAGGLELQDEAVMLKGLLTNQSFMVNPGTVTSAFLAREMYDVIGHASRTMRNLQRTADAGRPGPTPTTGDEALKEQLLLFAAFDAIEPPRGTVVYRSDPSLLVLFNELTPGPEPILSSGVDIVHNARQVLRRDRDRIVTDPQTAILAGTWETNVERLFVAQRTGQSVYGTYQAIADSNGATRVLAPGGGTSGALSGLGHALPVIQGDLERGYAVVLPAATEAHPVPGAWWRVDPASGETLGVGSGGRGITTTEEVINQISIGGAVISGTFLFAGSLMCMDHPNSACCVMANVAYTATGFVVGTLVGVTFFTVGAAIATILALDVGVGILGITGALPDPCSWKPASGDGW